MAPTKTSAQKSATKQSTSKKSSARASATTKTAAKKSAAKKSTAKKSTAKSSTAKRSAASRTNSRDAVAVLKNDHREVDALFKKFEATGPRATKSRQAIATKVIEALSVHASVEEQILYPALRRQLPAAESDVLEALEEHHVVKWTLSELESTDATDERFEAKMTVLKEMVKHHVKEEESGLFPKMRKAFTRTELDDMGTRLAAAKKTAPRRPHPRSPDTPPGNIVAAAVTAPLDAAAKLNEAASRRVREIVS
ncbi:MAG: hemerythrin domain-containing protein [Actinomycetota bacterium]|nr:hemerythrin domain-containing protein [Actinomycetota bacterium]